MSRVMSENAPRYQEPWGGKRPHYAPAPRQGSSGVPVGWLLAGALGAGLAYLAWSYIGPDLVRYLKIKSM
jgi:hypothetical protein